MLHAEHKQIDLHVLLSRIYSAKLVLELARVLLANVARNFLRLGGLLSTAIVLNADLVLHRID